MTALSPAFIQTIEAQRDTLNARFAQRARAGSRIDGHALLDHLEASVAPLIDRVHAVMPEQAAGVLLALYDASLDLFAASLLGPEARMPWVRRAWDEVLPSAVRPLAREPRQVAGCVCNAAFQVANQAGTRPEEWLRRMGDVAPHSQTVAELREAGTVAAWLAGMTQYRQAALAAAGSLPTPLAARSLGLPAETPAAEMRQLLLRLREHAWLTIETAANGDPAAGIASVATVGAFVGFGGLFYRPPHVSAIDQRLLIDDGRSEWELLADAYGAWFRRLGDAPARPAKSVLPDDVGFDSRGVIRWGNRSLAQPHLADAASVAAAGKTLAVTVPTSHHVFLFTNLGLSA